MAVMAEKKVEYNVSGRSIIDKLLLTGYWTPIGLVENAKHLSELCDKTSRLDNKFETAVRKTVQRAETIRQKVESTP